VDVKRKLLNPTYCYIRFNDRAQADAFLEKVKSIDRARSPLHKVAGEKITLT
jgi:hypothetical protein